MSSPMLRVMCNICGVLGLRGILVRPLQNAFALLTGGRGLHGVILVIRIGAPHSVVVGVCLAWVEELRTVLSIRRWLDRFVVDHALK